MAADPLHLGAVYIEEDFGGDDHGDTFELTFLGGAAGTQLTRLVIDGDQGSLGRTRGDILFDIAPGGLGADQAFPFTVLSLETRDPAARVAAEVVDGGSQLVLTFAGFIAGDKLVFQIDVDEVEDWNGEEAPIETINEGLDPITSGVEFQSSILRATFTAPHYEPIEAVTQFRNFYDPLLTGRGLDLPADDAGGKRDRTAGAATDIRQQFVPVALSGYVYHDRNNDGVRDAGEEGLAGVQLRVVPQQTIEPQQAVTVLTDAHGFYQFTGLVPGTYRIEELQPGGYLDGLDAPGTVAGRPRGQAANPGDAINNIELAGGDGGVEYNFGELLAVSLSGRVHLADRYGNCEGTTEQLRPVPGARVQLFDAGGTRVAETVTDETGRYSFTGLHPGTYKVVESTPAALIDGGEHVGTVAGQHSGSASDDTIADIVLASGQSGADYDFCEHEPASIAGTVYFDANQNGRRDEGESGIAGAEVQLQSAGGQIIEAQRTDNAGNYRFERLVYGHYKLVEVQPAGYIDGTDTAGTIGGVMVGRAVNPGDTLDEILLHWGDTGTNYNFGELLPAEISGVVFHDRNFNGVRDTGEEGLPGVRIELVPIATIADQPRLSVHTDSAGRYRFSSLAPGRYQLVQPEQPAGFVDAVDQAGTVGGSVVGKAKNPGDQIDEIVLATAQSGVDYNFGEIQLVSITGSVHLTDRHGNCSGAGSEHRPLANVTVLLKDATGTRLLAETHTDEQGRYRFEGLLPGTYTVHEVTPLGVVDGGQDVGTVDGVTVGSVTANDTVGDIVLRSGEQAIDYDFCEHEPSALSGFVYHDRDLDGVFESGETPLAGVVIELRAADGVLVASTTTGVDGAYRFDNLSAGEYTLREVHPPTWRDGIDVAGTVAGAVVGQAVNPGDAINQISLLWGDEGVNYNFGEWLSASITGFVHIDRDQDCIWDEGEAPLSGVTVQLLDRSGSLIATTVTDPAGRYHFAHLAPGEYSVRELQPQQYFHGGQRAGTAGGTASTDLIAAIRLQSGVDAEDYNFCEVPSSRLSGYVFQDGVAIATSDGLPPPDLRVLRDGLRTVDDKPLVGVIMELRDGIDGRAIHADEALPGAYAAGPIRVITDAHGHYEFRGLRGGRSYAVYQVHPTGYVDGIDTPGSTSGLALNPGHVVSEFILQRLTVAHNNDAIILIPLPIGTNSTENNFSEVRVTTLPPPPDTRLPSPPRITFLAPPPFAVPPVNRPVVPALVSPARIPLYGSGSEMYAWHLSVVDGGLPRGRSADPALRFMTVAHAPSPSQWQRHTMNDGVWTTMVGAHFGTRRSRALEAEPADASGVEFIFGIKQGIPLTGDFNGDGVSEVGVFAHGDFYLDLNGNRRWDEGDLWLHLGDDADLPVVGDWDGDGKDDIGIYGPAWPGDPRAIAAEPGLPDAENNHEVKPKNVPPKPDEAALGYRLLKRTTAGPLRSDLVDHVFQYGQGRQTPVSGDWNGDGIDSVGVFQEGRWRLDRDGDGRYSDADHVFTFGQPGDIPVVGDFDGNGVDEVGIYRNGTWYLDANKNRQLDAGDKVIQLGTAADLPVVGDWNGDGIDDPGMYRKSA